MNENGVDVSAPSTVLLSQFNVAALRRDFERLSVDDLQALASFPVEPHELIGRVVAVTHCLLLSLAPEHTTLELRAPPWQLLRLQLLDDTPKIWRKLRKRAAQLENRVTSFSPVQVRYGCTQLVQFILPSKDEKSRNLGTWQLERLAKVSTIAASLGAWVIFCLCCSVLPPLTINLRLQVSRPDITPLIQHRSLQKPGFRHHLPLKNVRASTRIGIKIGGRFMLFHVRFPRILRLDVKSVDSFGAWSVYCLDTIRSGRHEGFNSSPLSVSWWKSHEIETQLPKTFHLLALCQLTRFAQLSLLLQLGFHQHLFERPIQRIPLKTPQVTSPLFTLKFSVVATDSLYQLSLLGLGNAFITMETTLDELRSQLAPLIVAHLVNNDEKHNNFRFIYRGSILAVSQERDLPAVSLLPFALLVVSRSYSGKSFHAGKCASQLWNLHKEISQALVNFGLPELLCETKSQLTSVLTTQAFAFRQPFSTAITACSSPISSVLVEFFTHWRAFVSFQQLQDSLVLFQLPQRAVKKHVKAQKLPQFGLYNEIDDNTSESVPYGPNPQPLPRKRFNTKKEWMLPLYAVMEMKSPTLAVLKTPFRQDNENALSSPCRLVLAEEIHVIHVKQINHVTTERDAFGVQIAVFHVNFVRDESCELESLMQLQNVFVWLVQLRKTCKKREKPTEWMIDLYRFVQHPRYDFETINDQSIHYFRVRLSRSAAERATEAAFWSKNVDWTPSIASTDLYATMLRQMFETLCRSHPPACGVDSVKFSKFLYEAKIQPKLLSIGDAAFLFASNLTPGFTYEMDFQGFVRAVESLSQQFFSINRVKGNGNSSKMVPDVQHSMKVSQSNASDRFLVPLQRFCYEILVHLPSLTSTWQGIMDSWRRERKLQCIEEYALRFCAATRLRATWVGFVTWRIFKQRRQRLKEERLVATKLQSLARGRKQYLDYHRIRRIIVRTQLRIHARSELRRLRVERAAYVEFMRVRLVKWMRYQLWLWREWKRLNAPKIARRKRIHEKRLRQVGVAVFPIEIGCLRFTLYRSEPASEELNSENDSTSTLQRSESIETYDLEVVDSCRSWGQVISVSQQQINQFIVEEVERLSLQQELGLTVFEPHHKVLSPSTSHDKVLVARDSVVYPLLKPNILLLALARRLIVSQRDSLTLRWYKHSTDTSLGKLVCKGVFRSEVTQSNGSERILVQRHIVRVLEWANTFKCLLYTPATSSTRRYDLDSSFILSVLQFSDDEDLVNADSASVSESGCLHFIPHQIHRVLTGPHKTLAFRNIISYVLKYGICTPTNAMKPHVVAERERELQKRESEQREIQFARERQLIVMIQSCWRQNLARKKRQQLALSCYSKQFDHESGRFLYVQQYQSGSRIVLGERKPFSLFDKDVSLPPDEWQLVSPSSNSKSFFNPRRGIFSRYNDFLAATAIQRWFRDKMWNGVNNWTLRDTAQALRYHNNVHKPLNLTDLEELENIKRYALHLHVLQHQYKAAFSIYEAALKLSPHDPQTLVCFATLLVISCRYPAVQSWKRGMALLQQARTLIGDDFANILLETEQNAFRWALFLQPKNPHTIANYAVYLQCVHLDIDKAELLYRRALDLDPINDQFVINFQRLLSERAPGGIYAFAGPGKIALARSSEVCRFGSKSQWREMEDPATQPIPNRFFQDLRTGKCTWELPTEDSDVLAT